MTHIKSMTYDQIVDMAHNYIRRNDESANAPGLSEEDRVFIRAQSDSMRAIVTLLGDLRVTDDEITRLESQLSEEDRARLFRIEQREQGLSS